MAQAVRLGRTLAGELIADGEAIGLKPDAELLGEAMPDCRCKRRPLGFHSMRFAHWSIASMTGQKRG